MVTIYGTRWCGYCLMAKRLCDKRNLEFKFIDINKEGISKADLSEIVGKPVYTVPQVFMDDRHIGGYTEFNAYLSNR